jgi:hypothetical protein
MNTWQGKVVPVFVKEAATNTYRRIRVQLQSAICRRKLYVYRRGISISSKGLTIIKVAEWASGPIWTVVNRKYVPMYKKEV